MTGDNIPPEERKRVAALLRAAAREFGVKSNNFVTVQKHGGYPVRIRLDDLLKRIERKPPEPHS